MAKANPDGSILSVSVRNTRKVRRMLQDATDATGLVFSKKALQGLLLRRTKERFDELGSNENAQTGPDGTLWPEAAPATLKRHPNPNRLLYESGDLKRSIKVVRSRMGKTAVQSNTGGSFRIGIPVGGPTARYARVHNYGDASRNIPERRFLGISDKDVEAVDSFISRNFAKFGIRTSG